MRIQILHIIYLSHPSAFTKLHLFTGKLNFFLPSQTLMYSTIESFYQHFTENNCNFFVTLF